MISTENQWLINEYELEKIKWKVKNREWAKLIVSDMQSIAGKLLKEPVIVPNDSKGNIHQFISDESSWWLVFDWQNPEKHVDPITGQIYQNDKIKNGAWEWIAHNLLWRKLYVMGVLFQITGKADYLNWVKEHIIKYANFCIEREKKAQPNVVDIFRGALYDAKFAIQVALAYQFIDGPRYLSNKEIEIVHNLLRIRGNYLLEARMNDSLLYLGDRYINNFVTYINAAVACIAAILDEKEWLNSVTYDKRGFYKSLEYITPGGMWWEDSIAYHWYTVESLEINQDVLENAGYHPLKEWDNKKRFMSLYEFVISIANEKGKLPMFGDAFRDVSLSTEVHHLEYAAGKVDERFSSVLSWIYSDICARKSIGALIHGPIDLPETGKKSWLELKQSTFTGNNPADSGISILRQQGKEKISVWFKHGPRFLKHGHLDILSITVHALGEFMSPDFATYGYGNPRVGWDYYSSTLAHNTILVDGESQIRNDIKREKGVGGKLLIAENNDKRSYAIARAKEDVYLDCQVTRTVIVENDGYIVVLDEIQSNNKHVYDFIYRNYGELIYDCNNIFDKDRCKITGNNASYSYLSVNASLLNSNNVSCIWLLGGNKLIKGNFLSSERTTDMFFGKMPSNPRQLSSNFILMRSEGTIVRFAMVLEPLTMETGDPVFDDDYRVLTKDHWSQIESIKFNNDCLEIEKGQKRLSYSLVNEKLLIKEIL